MLEQRGGTERSDGNQKNPQGLGQKHSKDACGPFGGVTYRSTREPC